MRLAARSGRERLKALAVQLISAYWIARLRLRHGRRLRIGRNFRTNGRLVVLGPGRVRIGDDVNAWSHAETNVLITFARDSRIAIGAGTRLNGAGIQARTTVTIGKRCILGSTLLLDTDHHPLDPARRHDASAPVASAPIRVGDNVWLGGQSAVLKGVTIGENSVVAFRSVVASDVPANVVVAGNPARIVRRFEPPRA
ncbi:MAG: DapH/DapD/GlmU-related protein [Dehalococcoidia bacterium]